MIKENKTKYDEIRWLGKTFNWIAQIAAHQVKFDEIGCKWMQLDAIEPDSIRFDSL
jgi:hypothetical protein